MAGTVLNIVRVYDSLERQRSGSFGHGWKLANRDSDIQTSVAPTGRESLGVINPFMTGTRVFVTLPDGRRVGFTFAPQKETLPGLTVYRPAFEADPGVEYHLDSVETLMTRGRDGYYDFTSARPYNPASGQLEGPQYTLTAPDGSVYHLSTAQGIEEHILPSGVRFYYSDSGITSSTGESIQFTSDAAGRITSIEGPTGTRVVYSYDEAGNLSYVRNLASTLSNRYGYSIQDPHLLTLATAPPNQFGPTLDAGNVIQYAATPSTLPLTADLGGTGQFASQPYNGTLTAGETDRFTFTLRASEIESTKADTVLVGVEVREESGSGFQARDTRRLSNDPETEVRSPCSPSIEPDSNWSKSRVLTRVPRVPTQFESSSPAMQTWMESLMGSMAIPCCSRWAHRLDSPLTPPRRTPIAICKSMPPTSKLSAVILHSGRILLRMSSRQKATRTSIWPQP
jgi:YD repeat-containing protein